MNSTNIIVKHVWIRNNIIIKEEAPIIHRVVVQYPLVTGIYYIYKVVEASVGSHCVAFHDEQCWYWICFVCKSLGILDMLLAWIARHYPELDVCFCWGHKVYNCLENWIIVDAVTRYHKKITISRQMLPRICLRCSCNPLVWSVSTWPGQIISSFAYQARRRHKNLTRGYNQTAA